MAQKWKSSLRAIRASRALEGGSSSTVSTAEAGCVTVPSFSKDRRGVVYHVLIGAELHVPTAGETPAAVAVDVHCGQVVFKHVSSYTVLGPPYRVAVACTCFDWESRSGFAPQRSPDNFDESRPDVLGDRRTFRDAAAGCKHMMACNAAILKGPFCMLGPSLKAERLLEDFWSSSAPPSELDAYDASATALPGNSDVVGVEEDAPI